MDPLMLSFTLRFDAVFDDVLRVRAAGPNLVMTRVSPERTAARASRSPGRSFFPPVSPWSR